MASLIREPRWSIPVNVRAAFTTRGIAVEKDSVFGGFNLATHVGDDAPRVKRNRQNLMSLLNLRHTPVWLDQVHGRRTLVNRAGSHEADAAVTREVDVPLVVLVADCVPVLLCNLEGSCIGVVHAGWRGLAEGVIASAVAEMAQDGDITAWIGPSIGPCHFEVGADVREMFPDSDAAFRPSSRGGHWMMDLWQETGRQLTGSGVSSVTCIGQCTWCNNQDFYSFRKEGVTGRYAALIWISRYRSSH